MEQQKFFEGWDQLKAIRKPLIAGGRVGGRAAARAGCECRAGRRPPAAACERHGPRRRLG
jgi:hypothetical protein